jgi:hypothetical protein
MVKLTIFEQVTKFVQTVSCMFLSKVSLAFLIHLFISIFVDIIDKGVVDMKAEETAYQRR